MLHDLVEVRPLEGFRLYLRFDDGTQGEFDVAAAVPFDGVFSPLSDPAYFAQAKLHEELATVYWPNGADLDPEVLYATLTGIALPNETDPVSA